MRLDDLLAFTRQRPFVPYRIHIADGQVHEIRHPDQVIVLRSRAIIGVGGDDTVPEHAEHVALIHSVRIEEDEASAA